MNSIILKVMLEQAFCFPVACSMFVYELFYSVTIFIFSQGKALPLVRYGISAPAVLRLGFHDCLKYKDGTGGCDGCLNWKGVGAEVPNPNKKSDFYKYDPVNVTDNQGLQAKQIQSISPNHSLLKR